MLWCPQSVLTGFLVLAVRVTMEMLWDCYCSRFAVMSCKDEVFGRSIGYLSAVYLRVIDTNFVACVMSYVTGARYGCNS